MRGRVIFIFVFAVLSSGGWGKIQNKAQPHTHFHTFSHVSGVNFAQLYSKSSATITGASFGSRGGDSVSCLHRRSTLLLRQRKLPLCTDA